MKKLILIFLLFPCFSIGQTLQGAWNMNGNSNDLSGNGNNGTDQGSPTYTQSIDGSGINTAAGKYTNITNSTLSITGEITLMMWCNPTSTVANMAGGICRGGIALMNQRGYALGIVAGQVYGIVGDGGTNYSGCLCGRTLTAGKWWHLAMSYKPSTSITIFVNGEVEYSSTVSVIAAIGNIGNIAIGRVPTNGTYDFLGQIDDAKIFSTALTPAQVKNEYAKGKGILN